MGTNSFVFFFHQLLSPFFVLHILDPNLRNDIQDKNYELDLKRNELLTEQDKIMDSIITTSESIKKIGGVNSLLELKDFLESLSKYHAVYQDGHAYICEIE